MKKGKLFLVAMAVSAAGLFAFSKMDSGIVKGTVSPAEAGVKAWAISTGDTLKTDIKDGAFSFEAQPGTYQVIIEAAEPYKNTSKEGVEVKDGETTDLGEITLQQ